MRRLVSESISNSSPPMHSHMDPLHDDDDAFMAIPGCWCSPPAAAIGGEVAARNNRAAQMRRRAKEDELLGIEDLLNSGHRFMTREPRREHFRRLTLNAEDNRLRRQ